MPRDTIPANDQPASTARTDPHSEEAEQALLGVILTHPSSIATASDFLRPRSFYFEGHQQIFAACVELHRRGEKPNVIALRSYLGNDEIVQ